MKTAQLRKSFLDFYQSKGHVLVPGASTIPTGDQTILFTIAGMTPFKDILAGKVPRKHPRVANSQKCIRAADLEDVGLDGRHLTMFEMLGLWSFGDYSKKESISWSWEFITSVLNLNVEKIWVSVHTSDSESSEFWKSLGVPSERVVALGDKDNFWSMGPTGPCGPCTEIYFDQGPTVGCEAGQGPTPGAVCKGPGCDCDRYLEFWNNVFMEFNRTPEGLLEPLPAKNVDTGVGLERLAAILQNKTSAYEIDSFQGLQLGICAQAGLIKVDTAEALAKLPLADKQSIQVIADHMRTLVVTLTDGATFSNEGRGYVLRRILRRAVRYGNRLQENQGIESHQPFLWKLATDVAQSLGDFYPELLADTARVGGLIREEEERFLKTLSIGLQHFQEKTAGAQRGTRFSGAEIFVLHDSFGFPADLTALLCREQGLEPDLEGFVKHMEEQKERSRKAGRFYESTGGEFLPLRSGGKSSFTGYELQRGGGMNNPFPTVHGPWDTQREHFAVVWAEGSNSMMWRPGADGDFEIIFASSPFYPEGGGQVGDQGYLFFSPGSIFRVASVTKASEGHIHRLMPVEDQSPSEFPEVLRSSHAFVVDMLSRNETTRAHSATHLLHAALRSVLGNHVRQAGSMVSANGLRFDFSHPQALSQAEILRVEDVVLAHIQAALPVTTHVDVEIQAAREMGALAMFDEKYDERVRVLQMGGVSMELCGGTHVNNTLAIGGFRISSESSVTTGVRRIEALCGQGLLTALRREKSLLTAAAAEMRCTSDELPFRLAQLLASDKNKTKKVEELERKIARQESTQAEHNAVEVAPGLKLTTLNLGKLDSSQQLESRGDALKEKTLGVVVLGAELEGKAQLLVLVHSNVRKLFPQVAAGDLIKELAPFVEGRGGGKPEFAKAGGANLAGIAEALSQAEGILQRWADPGEVKSK